MDDRDLLQVVSGIIGKERTSDDCCMIKLGDENIILSTDMLHESTDFPKGMTDWQIGWMSAAVTLSDIASCGAVPLAVLLAAGLDEPERISGITLGAKDCCERFGAELAGGDIDFHSELTIVTTGIGRVEDEYYKSRRGAKPGDIICVTGTPGCAGAALEGALRYWKNLVEPLPAVREGRLLAVAGVSSMMDVSDGIALSLYDLSESSGVGFEIFPDKIPLSSGVSAELALHSGGDFGLLFTCGRDILPVLDVDYAEIGVVTDSGEVLCDGVPVEKRGYSHSWIDGS
ncbi:thiamine-phosphate kinase [Methanoplanus endosymbiosus]|uniref:Thiamine-monophosphate kinase n=1 Tax=Methanoplanus endosymbiosus TaxID=33865 RepID=A0A9E7PP75_9EURY|nr:thiamine-phosphate kinase [Methanoplanus endosymbiosus]UUX93874.1 thiamine-phosphate kinase [Methanoplanus endosymbiosus]